jgi:hypothetical protein
MSLSAAKLGENKPIACVIKSQCLIRKKYFPFIGFLCAGALSNWIGVFARSSQALLGKELCDNAKAIE